MATSNVVCAVAELWRFPVKSMRGERIEQAEFTERGLVGDRAHALIDAETGKVVSSESVRLFPDLLGCRAAFVEPPQSNRELPASADRAARRHSGYERRDEKPDDEGCR